MQYGPFFDADRSADVNPVGAGLEVFAGRTDAFEVCESNTIIFGTWYSCDALEITMMTRKTLEVE